MTDMVPAGDRGELALTPKEAPIVEGAASLDRSDFKLPIIRIVQDQTQGAPEGSAGKFWNNVTNEAKPQLLGTVLSVRKTRLLWPPDFARDAPILCASDDAVEPRPEYKSQLIAQYGDETGETCAACPFSQWGVDANGEQIPPACNLSYKYAVLDLETGMFGLLSLSRTDIKVARQLNTLLVQGMPKLAFGTRRVEDDRGNWYAFDYRIVGSLESEDVETAKQLLPLVKSAQVTAEMGTEGEQVDPTEPVDGAEAVSADEFDGFDGPVSSNNLPDIPF